MSQSVAMDAHTGETIYGDAAMAQALSRLLLLLLTNGGLILRRHLGPHLSKHIGAPLGEVTP